MILSLFPGLGLLDRAFELEGFCVVRGPDVIWGGDIREFHPPAGVFDGVIGGDPCQAHSTLSNLVRAKGLEPSFPDMTPEFARVVIEAAPRWFLRENVSTAPDLCPAYYHVTPFALDNAWLGEAQMRKRRFWFGVRAPAFAPNLRKWIPGVALECAESARGVTAGHDMLHGSGENPAPRVKAAGVTGRHHSYGMGPAHPGNPPRYTIEQMLELQGLPADFLKHAPFTAQGKRKAIGNGVPLAMGRALAQAVRKALAST